MNEEHVARQKDFIRGREPIRCAIDLEISPMLVYTYEAYEGNALKVKVAPQVVAASWKINDKPIEVRVLNQYKGYKSGIFNLNDKPLIKELHEVLDGVDILYGHNCKDFDVKHVKSRFIYHDLDVPKKWVIEDTLKIARKYFKFPKNNLDFITELLGMEGKTDVKHSDVIWKCIDGDPKAWKAMADYVRQDIKITHALYQKLAPWHETHYNLNFIKRKGTIACKVCLGTDLMLKGYDYSGRTFCRQKYKCKTCGHLFRGERVDLPVERVEEFNV